MTSFFLLRMILQGDSMETIFGWKTRMGVSRAGEGGTRQAE